MDVLERWIAETEQLEAALEGMLDTDERLAEYADAVSRVRDEAMRYRTAYRGAVSDLEAAVRLLDNAETSIIDTDLRRQWEAERARLRSPAPGFSRVALDETQRGPEEGS